MLHLAYIGPYGFLRPDGFGDFGIPLSEGRNGRRGKMGE
jgi:hypothetical protein